MTKPSRVEEIFWEALQKASAQERSDFLDEVCKNSPDVRVEVDRLLAAHERAGDFLNRPPSSLLPTEAQVGESRADNAVEKHRDLAGTRIGTYKLLEMIGEGGMGVVYMAEQEAPIRRRVALKVIKLGMDTPQVVARFEAERQALALMDHPGIAQVFDAGTTANGRPFFVMELVRGIPITEYCDQNRLPVQERLQLFTQVCQAVQHAHQKGIIHRDIKPSNILVTLQDGQAVPKVIDFGVAKAINQQLTEKTLFTNFAQMIGTPLYMSPEQAEMTALDVDTRTDIYSLGVLLYELLTGSTPFDADSFRRASFDEIRRIIREDDPVPPSTRISTSGQQKVSIAAHRQIEPVRLSRLVQGDLDWVVMKALEKDRRRRYESAGAFGADIGRYLSELPVEARPPTPIYRFRKFARRNRTAMAIAGILAIALSLGTVISSWQAFRAIQAERQAKVAMAEEAAQREIAEKKTAEAIASAEREKQAQQEVILQRDTAIRLTLSTLLQSAEQYIAKAELLWNSKTHAKEEALEAITLAAKVHHEYDEALALMRSASSIDPELIDKRSSQQLRAVHIASAWLSCSAVFEQQSQNLVLPEGFSRYLSDVPLAATPDGSRLLIAHPQKAGQIAVLDDTGQQLSRLLIDASIEQIQISGLSRLFVKNDNNLLEFDLQEKPTFLAHLLRTLPSRHLRTSVGSYSYRQEEVLTDTRRATVNENHLRIQARHDPAQTLYEFQVPAGYSITHPCFNADATQIAFLTHGGMFGDSHALGTGMVRGRITCTTPIQLPKLDSGRNTIIAPFNGGIFSMAPRDGSLVERRSELTLSKWKVVLPSYPVTQLNDGESVSATSLTSTGQIHSGHISGDVSQKGHLGVYAWRSERGPSVSAEEKTDLPEVVFARPSEEVVLIRSHKILAGGQQNIELQPINAIDGSRLLAPIPGGFKFFGAAADGSILMYADGTSSPPRTAVLDVLNHKAAREIMGLPIFAHSSLGPKQVLATKNPVTRVIQFWKLPEMSVLGEIPLSDDAVGSSDQSEPIVLFDRSESIALVLQKQGQKKDQRGIYFEDVSVVRFSPFLVTRFDEDGLPLPTAFERDILRIDQILFKTGENILVLKVADVRDTHLVIMNASRKTVRTVGFRKAVLCESLPRMLVSNESILDQEWSLYDTDTLTEVKKIRSDSLPAIENSSSLFALAGTVYRWVDGEREPTYRRGKAVCGITEGFQVCKTAGDSYVLQTDQKVIPLKEYEHSGNREINKDLLPVLSDNGATLLMPTGMWNARTGECLQRWELSERIAYDSNAQAVLIRVAEEDSLILKVYDLGTGETLKQVALNVHPKKLETCRIAWGPRSNRIAVWTNDGLDIIDTTTGNEVRSLSHEVHLEPVTHIATDEERSFVLSASGGVVLKWDKTDGKFQGQVFRSQASISSLDLSHNGESIVIVLQSGEILLVDFQGEPKWHRTPQFLGADCVTARFMDGDSVIAALDDGRVLKLSSEDGTIESKRKVSQVSITGMAITPSSKYIFALADDGTLSRLECAELELEGGSHIGNGPAVLCALDDEVCLVGADTIDAWNVVHGTLIWSIEPLGTPVASLAFQPLTGQLTSVDHAGRGFLFSLQDLSDAITDLGLPPLSRVRRTEDERLALRDVDRLYEELVFSEEVITAVEQNKAWNGALRSRLLIYAQSKARSDQELLGEAWAQVTAIYDDDAKLRDAAQIANAFCSLNSDEAQYARLLACIQIKRGEIEAALELLEGSNSNDVLSKAVRLIAYLALNEEERARELGASIAQLELPMGSKQALELANIRMFAELALAKYSNRAQAAYESEEWSEAADNYAIAFPLGMRDWGLLVEWSNSLAMTKDWKGAADIYSRVIGSGRKSLLVQWNEAMLELAAGDEEAYRSSCKELYSDFEGIISDHEFAYLLAIAGSFGEGAIEDLDRVVAQARKAVDGDPRNPGYRTALATALYRDGQTDEAIETVLEARQMHSAALLLAPKMAEAIQASRLNGETVLALAYHQKGDTESRDKQMAAVEKLITQLEESPPEHTSGLVPWALALGIEISRRELAKISNAAEPVP